MKVRVLALLAAGALVAVSASPGLGATIRKKENRQERRIQRGVRSGKITPKEANRLENQQETIEKERQQAWEDGKLTHRERRDIRHDQRRLGQDIRQKKENDKRVRP